MIVVNPSKQFERMSTEKAESYTVAKSSQKIAMPSDGATFSMMLSAEEPKPAP